MSNSNKACLISTSPPNEAMILKCFMKLMCNGKEIISYNGNVFSIDETKNLHKWDSGGLIYPADIIGRVTFIPNGIKILVSVDKGPSIYYVIIFLRFLTPSRSLSPPQIIS